LGRLSKQIIPVTGLQPPHNSGVGENQ